GGGFNILAIEHEGRDVARWLNQRGVTAFVLRYRIGIGSTEYRRKAGVEDALLAMKTVRRRAAEWKINPRRIGMMGFSAGAFLTLAVATQYTPESPPDFAMPIYDGLPDGYYKVPADAPPLFMALAFDDRERTIAGATGVFRSWKKANIPAELHIFHDGAHGFGMNKKGKASDSWIELLERWMNRLGLITAS
ncbi:MAG: alpha/beta hydrolase, partial [Candidatus Omnitrophica bacterium]|nr:alpha/beta hydrolase [Candidatus Omnitrophota bacterium]